MTLLNLKDQQTKITLNHKAFSHEIRVQEEFPDEDHPAQRDAGIPSPGLDQIAKRTDDDMIVTKLIPRNISGVSKETLGLPSFLPDVQRLFVRKSDEFEERLGLPERLPNESLLVIPGDSFFLLLFLYKQVGLRPLVFHRRLNWLSGLDPQSLQEGLLPEEQQIHFVGSEDLGNFLHFPGLPLLQHLLSVLLGELWLYLPQSLGAVIREFRRVQGVFSYQSLCTERNFFLYKKEFLLEELLLTGGLGTPVHLLNRRISDIATLFYLLLEGEDGLPLQLQLKGLLVSPHFLGLD